MPPSLWLGSGAAFGSAASPRNYPPAISRQTARAPAAPPPALRADRKSYSIPGGKSAGSGPRQGRGFFLGKILLPASAWSPFRHGSFLTSFLPSAGLLPPGPSALSPVRGGRWQEGGGSFLASLLPWASALPPGPLALSPVRGGRWQG